MKLRQQQQVCEMDSLGQANELICAQGVSRGWGWSPWRPNASARRLSKERLLGGGGQGGTGRVGERVAQRPKNKA